MNPSSTYQPPSLSRARRALNFSLAFVLLLAAVFAIQSQVDWRSWAVVPGTAQGLLGLLGAPLLHANLGHLVANASALLILGTLAGTVYPSATVRALPLVWLGSGLGAWLWGDPGSHHLGASGLTHGLMFLVLGLGLLRRDRMAIAAALVAILFYGGMLLSVLPQELGVSWQSHMGGAMAGGLGALLFRRADPMAPKPRYSWEDEDEGDDNAGFAERNEHEESGFTFEHLLPENPEEGSSARFDGQYPRRRTWPESHSHL